LWPPFRLTNSISNANENAQQGATVTLIFWIIKIMVTTVGETAADFLAFNLKLGLTNTSLLMAGLLIVALVLQLRAHRYLPAYYWTVVVFVSIVGALISDNLVDNLGVSLVTTTIIFTAALVLVFVLWYASEKDPVCPQH
jgi:uncharacterized membrane-anchored protein